MAVGHIWTRINIVESRSKNVLTFCLILIFLENCHTLVFVKDLLEIGLNSFFKNKYFTPWIWTWIRIRMEKPYLGPYINSCGFEILEPIVVVN